jgi:DMSO/TMAO reductase YedYZ molybdopterin-dependent catalytic subunit
VAVSGASDPGWESIQLPSAEVREYRGIRLDSAASSFRENSIAGTQYVDALSYRLVVSGMVANPIELSYPQAIDLPAYEKVVTLNCVEGWDATVLWKGISLEELVQRAEPSPDATTLIFRCADGYETTLDLAWVRERDILLAYGINGVTLPPERGFPFIVVAEERWGYKWARWVTEIVVSDDDGYRGFWESRGFALRGILSEPSREANTDLTK